MNLLGKAKISIIILVISCSTENEGQERQVTPYSSKGVSETGSTNKSTEGTDGNSSGSSDDVLVSLSGESFNIFAYEAYLVDGKATSQKDKIPTVNINYEDAKAACVKAGYRLCTHSEWKKACKGPNDYKYAFSTTHETTPPLKEKCDVARETNNTPGSLPSKTGSFPDCVTKDLKIYDMIGNASEWTDGDSVPIAAGVAFYQTEEQSSCEGALSGSTEAGSTMDPKTVSSDLGFRCCSDKEASSE